MRGRGANNEKLGSEHEIVKLEKPKHICPLCERF